MRPETRYTRSGDVSIAYQVVGDGPRDLLYIHGWVSNVEYGWEVPEIARYLRRLAVLLTSDPLRPSRDRSFRPGSH